MFLLPFSFLFPAFPVLATSIPLEAHRERVPKLRLPVDNLHLPPPSQLLLLRSSFPSPQNSEPDLRSLLRLDRLEPDGGEHSEKRFLGDMLGVVEAEEGKHEEADASWNELLPEEPQHLSSLGRGRDAVDYHGADDRVVDGRGRDGEGVEVLGLDAGGGGAEVDGADGHADAGIRAGGQELGVDGADLEDVYGRPSGL